MFRSIVFAAVLLAWCSCKSSSQASKSGSLPAVDTLPLVELQTSGCFGFCPVYTLTVFQQGQARYVGLQNVELEGEFVFQLSPSELVSLKETVFKTNLWQYPDRVPSQVADAPFNTLRVFRPDSTKSVSGSIDRPQPLLDLEKQLKAIGTTHGLELQRGVNPNDPSRANRRTVTVLLEDGINAGNWVIPFKDLKLQLVRRLGAANEWLVAYDAGLITEEQLIQRLTNAEGVRSVYPGEKNKK